MKFAIVGAGSLGKVYGARLAHAGHTVTFVLRPPTTAMAPIRIERIEQLNQVNGAIECAAPNGSNTLPADVDAVLVCVQTEQLDDSLLKNLGAPLTNPDVPVVVMTAALPNDLKRLQSALGGRLVHSMPGVTAYDTPTGVVRYWLPSGAPTLFPSATSNAVTDIVGALDSAGLQVKSDPNTSEPYFATIAALAPIAVALSIAGGIDPLLEDRRLMKLALEAKDETLAIASDPSPPPLPLWLKTLSKFNSPTAIKMALALGGQRFQEAFTFVDRKFATELRSENAFLCRGLLAFGRSKRIASPALEELLSRVR